MAIDDKYTITLLHFENSLKDEVGRVWTPGTTPPAFSNSVKKFGISAAYFASQNGLSYSSSKAIPEFSSFGTEDWTVDYWEYRTGYGSWPGGLGMSQIGYNQSRMLFGYSQSSWGDNQYCYLSGTNAGSYNIMEALWSGIIRYNQWVHRAYVRKGTTFYAFENGVLQNTANIGSVAMCSVMNSCSIGNIIGYMDEFRISKGIARWTSNFTPPTKAYYSKRALMLNNDTTFKYSGTVWTPVSSSWSALTNQEKETRFISDGMDTLPSGQAFLDFGNGTLLEYTETIDSAPSMSIKATPIKKLVLAKSDISIRSVQYIDQLKITSTTGNGDVRIVISTDQGISWKTFDGFIWKTVDMSDTNNVFTDGMSATAINAITKDKWTELIGQDPQAIRFGYAISENALADKLDFTVDMKGMWFEGLPGTDYRAAYANKTTLVVQLLSSGDYKINY